MAEQELVPDTPFDEELLEEWNSALDLLKDADKYGSVGEEDPLQPQSNWRQNEVLQTYNVSYPPNSLLLVCQSTAKFVITRFFTRLFSSVHAKKTFNICVYGRHQLKYEVWDEGFGDLVEEQTRQANFGAYSATIGAEISSRLERAHSVSRYKAMQELPINEKTTKCHPAHPVRMNSTRAFVVITDCTLACPPIAVWAAGEDVLRVYVSNRNP